MSDNISDIANEHFEFILYHFQYLVLLFNENMTQNMIQSTARDYWGLVCKNLYFPSIRLKEKEYKIDSYHLEIFCFESCKCHFNIKASIYLTVVLHVSHKLLCNTAQLQKLFHNLLLVRLNSSVGLRAMIFNNTLLLNRESLLL